MITNLKAVSNPLTIIAIFAALAEVVGTVMLGIVDVSIQATFVWFVMLFPILIVVLFFATLNFNFTVLYAPSDFKDESNFLAVVAGVKKIKDDLEDIEAAVEAVSDVVAGKTEVGGEEPREGDDVRSQEESVEESPCVDEPQPEGGDEVSEDIRAKAIAIGEEIERKRLDVKLRLDEIRGRLESAQVVANTLVGLNGLPNSPLQAKIIELLAEEGEGMELEALCAKTGRGLSQVRAATRKLVDRGVLEERLDYRGYSLYRLAKLPKSDSQQRIALLKEADRLESFFKGA